MRSPDPATGEMAAPLAGRRIVVTRAERQSRGLREKLETQGATVLLLPTIEIAAPDSYALLDDALRDPKRFDWLVVTSANAVRVLSERLDGIGMTPAALAHLRSAAVGRATAEALRSLGLKAEVVPEQYVGESLAAALGPHVRGQAVLLVRGAAARDVVPTALTDAGAQVTIADAYRTMIPADAASRALQFFGSRPLPDAVVFTSGSTVTHLMDVLREAGLLLPPLVRCVSIGPVTSAAIRNAGLPVAAEATEASLDGLVDACTALFAR